MAGEKNLVLEMKILVLVVKRMEMPKLVVVIEVKIVVL